MAVPTINVNIRRFSAGENEMLRLAIKTFAEAADKKDIHALYHPPALAVAACSQAYNKAFDSAYRDEVAAVLGPEHLAAVPAIPAIVLGIVGNIIGNIVGNIISKKVS
jgi:hypothetical protein